MAEFKYKKHDLSKTSFLLDLTGEQLKQLANEIGQNNHDLKGFVGQLKEIQSDISKIIIEYCKYTTKAIDIAETK